MPSDTKKYPPCFGNLNEVFPKSADGLRKTPERCMPCIYKTECLKSAMNGKGGLSVREEMLDRAYDSGMVGFFNRWSKKKDLKRRQKEIQQGKK
jgi:hypothetical protein